MCSKPQIVPGVTEFIVILISPVELDNFLLCEVILLLLWVSGMFGCWAAEWDKCQTTLLVNDVSSLGSKNTSLLTG